MTLERTASRQGPGKPSAKASLIPYYVLAESPCPYLANRWERKLLTEINGKDPTGHYSLLSKAGFRRSHQFAYRPACDNCKACIPVRVLAKQFVWSRSLKRIRAMNRDLTIEETPARATEEHFGVFKSYVVARHDDGEMAEMSFGDYRGMVEQTRLDTRIAEFRAPDGKLVAACLLDWLEDGPSAVYSFFDPSESRRSLGTHMVLWLIEAAQQSGLPHVYLGYWIEKTHKMSYKARFRPLEGLGPKGWQLVGAAEGPEPS